ncbi:MAG: hypothetical protein R3C17_13340 [Planctomycetaceae bacterium]
MKLCSVPPDRFSMQNVSNAWQQNVRLIPCLAVRDWLKSSGVKLLSLRLAISSGEF